jgi:pyruvate formate lyase activating enzyme
MTAEGLFEQIKPALDLCGKGGGITLSGGEALLQEAGAGKLLELCKAEGFNTAIETSGLLTLALYGRFLPLVDIWLFGMRVTTEMQGLDSSGQLENNLRFLKEEKARIIPVVPVIPGVYDRDEVLNLIGALVNRYGLGKPLLNHWNENYDALYGEAGFPLRMSKPLPEAVRSAEEKIKNYFEGLNYEKFSV